MDSRIEDCVSHRGFVPCKTSNAHAGVEINETNHVVEAAAHQMLFGGMHRDAVYVTVMAFDFAGDLTRSALGITIGTEDSPIEIPHAHRAIC